MARRFAGVRVRTTAAAVVVVGIALIAVAVSLVALPRQSLLRRVDSSARSQAREVALFVRRGVPATDVLLPLPESLPGTFFQIYSDDGRLLGASDDAPLLEGPPEPPLPFDVSSVDIDGEDYRVAIEPAVAPNGEIAYIIAGAPTAPVEEAISVIRRVLVVALPTLLALVGLAAWTITGRALRPVERIRAQVGEISASALHRRVPEPDADDEVAALARTMNEMLDRLEAATEQRRRFVSDASHELRSPLATIRAQLEVALAAGDTVEWREVARRVLAEEDRLQRLVDDLLVLARTDEVATIEAPVDVDLDHLVVQDAERHGPIVDVSGVGPARVRGDRHRLASVVRNLVDNAVRHARSQVAVAVATEGDEVVLHVDDDGDGVAPVDRDRVFERFTRLDDARTRHAGGAGLGLAVVRAVVAAHGGAVAVDDAPLGGARFTVRLPSA